LTDIESITQLGTCTDDSESGGTVEVQKYDRRKGMKAGGFGASFVACTVVAMLVVLSASAGGVAAKSDNRVLKVVETQDVDLSVVVELPSSNEVIAFLEENPEIADMLVGALGLDCLESAAHFLENIGAVGIDLDGKAHINMFAWVNDESLDVKLHFVWHGTITLTLFEREPSGFGSPVMSINLDIKNAQLMTHATFIGTPPYVVDVMLNAHVVGEATIAVGDSVAEGSPEFDISCHVLLKISDGQLQMLKITVSSWLDAMLAEI
jgi:hypothetical protein